MVGPAAVITSGEKGKIPMNNEQRRIQQLAQNLLTTLDAVVPGSTAHYAVEGARRALRELIREADTITTAEPTTWTFFGHWENGQIEVQYKYPGEVQDDRVEDWTYGEGLWAACGSGVTVEEAEAAALANYEEADKDEDQASALASDQDH